MMDEEQQPSYLQRIMEISISDPDKYSDANILLGEIRQQLSPFYSQAEMLTIGAPNGNEVKNGDLVHLRGAIQNDHQMHMYESIVEFKLVDGRQVRMSPAFLDPAKIAETNIISPITNNPDAICRVYTVMAIPGQSKWAALGEQQQPALADEITRLSIGGNQVRKNNLLSLRVYEEGIADFDISSIVDLYGIYYEPAGDDIVAENDENCGGHTEFGCSTAIYELPTIYMIDHRVLCREDLVPLPPQFPTYTAQHLHEQLLKLVNSFTGTSIATNYFLAALVARTYEWKEEQPVPLCTVPFAFLSVLNSKPFIECAKLLLPMVQVVPLTPQMLEQERLFSRMDHDTGLLHSGRLQLARGTLLVLDFTHYRTAAKPTKDNYVLENIDALQWLIERQKLMIDSGPHVQKFPLAVDIPVMALCPGLNTYFLKFPTLVPLPKREQIEEVRIDEFENECASELLANMRWHLSKGRAQLDKIRLEKDEQTLIAETFTNIREQLGGAVAADHFRHLLALTRLHTALGGQHEMKYILYEYLMNNEYERLKILRALKLA